MNRLKEIEDKINKRIQEKFGEELKTRKYLYSDEVLPIVYEELGIPYTRLLEMSHYPIIMDPSQWTWLQPKETEL